MDSRERVRQALDHKEADRVPFDLGGTGLTTIHDIQPNVPPENVMAMWAS